MSASHATAVSRPGGVRASAPAPQHEQRPQQAQRTRLHVVRSPAQARARMPFVVLCMLVLGAALLGTLLLNTSMAQGEYERFALQTRLAQSAQRQQELLGELTTASSSPRLADAARGLGMVPASGAGYLRLADGAVLGDPTPAAG